MRQDAAGAGVWRDFSWQTGQAQQPDPASLHTLVQHLGTDSEAIVRLTAEKNANGMFTGPGSDYINGVFSRSQVVLPAGLTLHIK
ncbi:MAG TPA: hypothetical protein VGI74_19065 [Streptosporangiaceae bacterium]